MNSRRVKLAVRAPIAILGSVLVASYVLGALALNVLVDTEAVRGWLAPRASAVLNRPVSLGDARVALLPRPSIHVADVRVDNLSDFEGPALAFVERVRLDVRWLPLLIGRVAVHRVHLDGPRVYLAVDGTGTSNFGDLMPAGVAGETPHAPVALTLTRVAVHDASVSYFDAPGSRSLTIAGAGVRVTLSPEGAAGWRADVVAESDSLHARMETVTDEILRMEGPTASLIARGDGTGHSIAIDDGRVGLSGETLALSGRISGLTGARPSYDLQFTNEAMDAGIFAAAFPARARSTLIPAMDGELGITVQVAGSRAPGEPPVIRGSLRLDNVGIRMSGQIMVDRLTGTIGVTPDSLVLDSLTGVFADGPFELSGTVARDTRAMVLSTWARPDLDALDRLGLVPAGTTLSGDATLDLLLAGRLGALDSLDVEGTVTLAGVQAKDTRVGVPAYVPAGELTLAGGDVSWSDLVVLIGEDELVTSGRVRNVIPLPERYEAGAPALQVSLRARRIDLGAVFPAEEGAPAVTYAQVAFAHLGHRLIDGRAPSAIMAELGLSRPLSLPARGTVELQLDTLDFRANRLESLSARVELTDSMLVVDAPSFSIWGGTGAGDLTLGIGELPEEPFALQVSVEGAATEDLLGATTPVGEAISGTSVLELDLAGTVDRDLLPVGRDLSGRAHLVTTDGRVHDTGPNLVLADFLGAEAWADVSFTTWDTEVQIIERRLEVISSELIGEQGKVVLSGLLHLDGSHDLSLGLSIPPEHLGTVSLRRTGVGQSVLDHLSAAGSALDLGLRMSGALRTPMLEPDASNATASTR